MVRPKTAYELSASQVTTPDDVVALFWSITTQHRKHFDSVVDYGAGDCRFSTGNAFSKYTGIEIDPVRSKNAKLDGSSVLIHECAFADTSDGYDACIGNPPYVRHHDIGNRWRQRISRQLQDKINIPVNQNSNLFIYFMCLGLLRTHKAGLLSVIVPFEWVSRPSARYLRDYIHSNNWNVSVYRFRYQIFDGVLTTASISIIDKSTNKGRWRFYDIDEDHKVSRSSSITNGKLRVLPHETRGDIWCLRGLSPGSQAIFTLTEGERIHNGLHKRDVVPCVTSLRPLPPHISTFTNRTFHKYYVSSGEKCWLIRSNAPRLSTRLNSYLESIPEELRNTATCLDQAPWYNFKSHPVPQLLVASGFTHFGPKVVINSCGAHSVGSVYGVHSNRPLPLRKLQLYLSEFDFEHHVVPHAKLLKKVEVGQLNGILNKFNPYE